MDEAPPVSIGDLGVKLGKYQNKSLKNLILKIVARLIKLLHFIYCSTIRIQVVNNQWLPSKLNGSQNNIYVFWHSKTFILLSFSRNLGIGTLTLPDWKNIIFDELCKLYKYRTILVENNSGVIGVIRKLITLLKNGHSLGLAVDGPKGPVTVIRPGAIYLAKTTGKPIVAANILVNKSIRIKTRWDRYELPFLFSQVTITLSQPLFVDDSNTGPMTSEIKKLLGEA